MPRGPKTWPLNIHWLFKSCSLSLRFLFWKKVTAVLGSESLWKDWMTWRNCVCFRRNNADSSHQCRLETPCAWIELTCWPRIHSVQCRGKRPSVETPIWSVIPCSLGFKMSLADMLIPNYVNWFGESIFKSLSIPGGERTLGTQHNSNQNHSIYR